MNLTEPSPRTAVTPPVWKLNGSSLGPQLFTVHRQVAGPPTGLALLLILATRDVAVGALESLFGPEKPLPNASGSAHA
jgi:hypothetical protein